MLKQTIDKQYTLFIFSWGRKKKCFLKAHVEVLLIHLLKNIVLQAVKLNGYFSLHIFLLGKKPNASGKLTLIIIKPNSGSVRQYNYKHKFF